MDTNQFLKECKVLVDKMDYQQECCDYYLYLFNRPDLAGFYTEYIEGNDFVKKGLTFGSTDNKPLALFREFLQHAAEYHATEKRRLDAELEDLVKGRYLENSH